ncbi:MAG: cytochrome-c peroxidase [Bacteroidetes bacterium]|nr:cytochrome-c peroxidase [Bacteroidota bacterium]
MLMLFLFVSWSLTVYKKFTLPSAFPQPIYDFKTNPLTEDKIELGRLLFYDPILSSDSTISCVSCHSPYNAFAHTDHKLSHGIKDQIGTRNAPALFNLAWQKSFMWDGAIHHLDVQALAPISNVIEMNETLANIVQKLKRSKFYRQQFGKIYNDGNITGERILKVMSQFQLTLISATSKYDQVKAGKEFFNEQEQNGYQLFAQKCASCHREPLFSTYEFANNGLALDSLLKDEGRKSITERTDDNQHFKIPSLRNLKYTFPYMHDGRFSKLSDVLKHYAKGESVQFKQDERLKKMVGLTSNEQVDIIAFLLTLSDEKFVFDKKHQFPMELLKK